MLREAMIEQLIELDLSGDGWDEGGLHMWLSSILRNGFRGYSDMTLEEIQVLYEERFGRGPNEVPE